MSNNCNIVTLKIPLCGFIKQGDTIPKISFALSNYSGDLTTATIKMQIYKGNTKIIDVSNGSGITVIDANNFEIDEVSASNNNLPVGTFIGDLEITEASGDKKTYFNVEYTIIKEYTK